jgi:hypothetical protein
MEQAKTLSQIYQSCHPRPLLRQELEQFFVDTADARDPVMSRRQELRMRLERNADANPKLLLAGHGGCGKSTELVKLADELKDSFLTVAFDVRAECNPSHVPVEDVLVVAMERVLSACKDAGLAGEMGSAEKTLREVHQWFAEELHIDETQRQAGVEAEAGVDVSSSWFGRALGLLVKLKGSIRRAEKGIHRMTYEEPRRMGALVLRCNLLMKEAKQVLHTRGRRLLLVIEGLDKVNLTDSRRIFLEQPTVLADLETSLICTVPIFLRHSPQTGAMDAYFECVDLPMIKVREFDESPCPPGRQAIEQILQRRIARDLLHPDALAMLIEKSGGVLRDVFAALIIAAQAAESLSERGKQQPVITPENVRYALNRRKNEYARSISVLDLPEGWQLEVGELYDRLRELAGEPVRNVPSDNATRVLLWARAILEYNGEQWYCVHPLVRELLEVMKRE